MTFKWIGRLGLLMMLGLLTNCAAVTTGTDQNVEITSDPLGAKCLVVQDGVNVGHIDSTPAIIQVDKSWYDLQVTCDKPGFETELSSVPSKTQGATLGNILIGGGIGLIIDASSGAMRYYPDSHMSFLVPEKFDTADHANKFFDELRDKVTARNEIDFIKVKETCIDLKRDDPSCLSRIKEMESALEEKLQAVENRRNGVLANF